MPMTAALAAFHEIGADAGRRLIALAVEMARHRARRGEAREGEVGVLDRDRSCAASEQGLSMAVPQTSPSPCVAWVSPTLNRPPATSTGR